MTHVYILESIETPEHHYVGITADLRARLQKHNAGNVSHPSKFRHGTSRLTLVRQ